MKSAKPEVKEAIPTHIVPDYELLERIGSGAYGEVWRGRNVMGELRAAKIIYRSRFNDARPFEREFEGIRRFEPISRSHPSQLAILHVGKNDQAGCFYYIMELADAAQPCPNKIGHDDPIAPQSIAEIDGERLLADESLTYHPHTLRHDLDQCERLSIPDCIRIGLSLTTALGHLHEHGLVHRDIKPSNVIFVKGVPKLGDIGLVTEAGDTQSIVGTEGYIPPEGPGTPQADIFSLGKVLYEISTGMDRRRFAELPEDLRSWADRRAVVEFNEILLKACAKDPARRYRSAEEFRADLELLHGGRSLRLRRSRERIWSLTRKILVAVGAIGATLVLANWVANKETGQTGSAQPPPDILSSTDGVALEEYRKGVQALQVEKDNDRAIQHFKNAIKKDANFAEAWARLAWAHYSYGETDPNPEEGPAAAEKAVKLNDNLAYAHSMVATARLGELKWAEADKERRCALELNPYSQEILLESALNLACMGKTNEALGDLEKALRANPDSISKQREYFYGLVYGWCRRYDKALEIFDRLGSGGGYFSNQHCALAYLGAGDFTNFIHFSKQALLARAANTNQVNEEFNALEEAFQQGGQQKYWELSLKFESSRHDSDHFMRMAAIHARLNQRDEAFNCLRRATHETYFATGLYTNPSFDSLRKDKRFGELEYELWH